MLSSVAADHSRCVARVTHTALHGGTNVAGAGGEVKKKKKKKRSKKKKPAGEGAEGAGAANGSTPTQQTEPPSVPVRLLFPSGK